MSDEIENFNLSVINSDRDYIIRKGRILERFQERFHDRYKYNCLYEQVSELLIRDADPYQIIEKLIEINDEQFQQIKKLIELIPPQPIIIPNQKP